MKLSLVFALLAAIFVVCTSEDGWGMGCERRKWILQRDIGVLQRSLEKCKNPPADCGDMMVANGTFIVGCTTEGENGTVLCHTNFTFYGENRTATCSPSGQWEGLDGDCIQTVWTNQIDFDGEIERKVDTGFEVIVIATPDTTLAFYYIFLFNKDDLDDYLIVNVNVGTTSVTIDSGNRLSFTKTGMSFMGGAPIEVRIKLLGSETFQITIDGVHLTDYNVGRNAETYTTVQVGSNAHVTLLNISY